VKELLYDVDTFAGERQGDPPAHPVARTGDESDSTPDTQIHARPSVEFFGPKFASTRQSINAA